jgi:GIY-YIG catalytic domain
MNVDALIPAPTHKQAFRLAHRKFVPSRSGCYVLTTFVGDVLYVGLAVDLNRRLGDHLDTPAKTAETPLGRAVWFHWLETTKTNHVDEYSSPARGEAPTLEPRVLVHRVMIPLPATAMHRVADVDDACCLPVG